MNGKRPILIDTDIGFGSGKSDVDDVLAIMLARSLPCLDIVAITPVGGNVEVARASANLHAFLKRTGMAGIPHAWSSSRPLDPKMLAKSELWDRAPPQRVEKPEDAPRIDSVDLILKTVGETAEALTIVAIGPLSNIAIALAKEPGIAAGIGEIVMMGGSCRAPGSRGLAEFNILVDPFAAALVFNTGIPVTMFGLDVTTKRRVLPRDLEPWNLPGSPLLQELYESYLKFMLHRAGLSEDGRGFAFFHDAFPIAYFARPEIFTIETCGIDVEIRSGPAYGTTIVDFSARRHRIAMDVDESALMDYVVGTVASEWKDFG